MVYIQGIDCSFEIDYLKTLTILISKITKKWFGDEN